MDNRTACITYPKRLTYAGYLLGFSLGGFFDGILLHQILQWHHLLSNVDAVRDMRWQVMADGLFHALMYVIAAVALVRLWSQRTAFAQPGADRVLWALALIGFGSWHMLDGILSHWVLGIHRIRVDSPQPLLWDLIWFGGFGVVPALAGWRALRKGGGGTPGGLHAVDGPGAPAATGSARGRAAAGTLAVMAVLAGPIAALPAGPGDQVTVLFAPGVTPGQAFNALARLDARVLWVDQAGGMWAVAMDNPQDAWALYRSGAMLVSRSSVGLGCFSWLKAAETPAAAPRT